jgi:hypothetical protein
MAILLIFIYIFPELFYATDDTFTRATLFYLISIIMSSVQSSVVPYSSFYTTSNTVTTPLIRKAATGSPLVRVILKSYSKEILKSISKQFLNLAVKVRL